MTAWTHEPAAPGPGMRPFTSRIMTRRGANARAAVKAVPAATGESDALSRNLKHRGVTFVGSTICYAFMQAVGMVSDHVLSCLATAKSPGSTEAGMPAPDSKRRSAYVTASRARTDHASLEGKLKKRLKAAIRCRAVRRRKRRR